MSEHPVRGLAPAPIRSHRVIASRAEVSTAGRTDRRPLPAVAESARGPWLLGLEVTCYALALIAILASRTRAPRSASVIEYRVMIGLAIVCALVALARWWAPRWTGAAAVTVLSVGIGVLALSPLGSLGPLRLMLSLAIGPILLVATARRCRWWTVGIVVALAVTQAGIDASLGGNTLSRDLASGLIRGYPTPQFVWITGALLIVAPVAVGLLLRSGDASRRAEAQARRAETLARVRIEERLQVARELHDLVANHVTGMLVAAQAAGLARDDSDRTGRSLGEIEAAGNRALAAMRRMVEALRAGHDVPDDVVPPGGEVLTTTGVTAMDAVRSAIGGLENVELTVSEMTDAPLPADIGVTVHRILVEALTNARRHTPSGFPVTVDVDLARPGWLAIQVDNACGPSSIHGGGYGLVGLRERVAAIGGRLEAGPAPGGRWRLRAELPVG